MQSLIVTLDGPAGSGKSTVARRLAARLGLSFLDTGAMYRGLAARALALGLDPTRDTSAVIQLAHDEPVDFDWTTDPPRLHVAGKDLTDQLREPAVTALASGVATLGPLRAVLVDAQRRIGREHPRLVTEGRDQGSVVFPAAQVKFYLDADPWVRARRRASELTAAGRPADPTELHRQILERDHRDQTRADGPLVCPDDALRVDTSAMTLDQVVAFLEAQVRAVMERGDAS